MHTSISCTQPCTHLHMLTTMHTLMYPPPCTPPCTHPCIHGVSTAMHTQIMPKAELPLLTSIMMVTQALMSAPVGMRAKKSVKARNSILLLGCVALIGANAAFALLGTTAGEKREGRGTRWVWCGVLGIMVGIWVRLHVGCGTKHMGILGTMHLLKGGQNTPLLSSLPCC